MESCPFCKIVEGKIPAEKIYTDDSVIAFPDIHPKAPGHTLVIPILHQHWFQDLPEDIYQHLFAVAKQLAQQLKEKNNADYVQLSIVGTDVPHVHIHLIPRKLADKAPRV